MLPLRSRGLGGAEPLTLHARSVIFGMALTIGAAGIGYLAHPSPKEQVLQVGSLAPGQAGVGSDGVVSGGGQALGTVASGSGNGASSAAGGIAAAGGSAGSAGSAASGSAGGGGGGTTAAFAASKGQLSYGPLRATDQGVTKNGIKLGFLIANTNQLSAAGFNAGLAGDQTKIITAWMNELNRTGGVLGRKLSAYSQTFNVLDANDMQAACKTMTQDQKVFSVITTGGYDSVAQLCIAKENKTPFISTDPEPASWYKESAPYM